MLNMEQVHTIADELEKDGFSESSIQKLKSKHQDLHITIDEDDNIIETKPVIEKPEFNIYLVDTSDHCFSLTSDEQIATGIVIARIDEEDRV